MSVHDAVVSVCRFVYPGDALAHAPHLHREHGKFIVVTAYAYRPLCVRACVCSRVWLGVDVWVSLYHGDVWVCVRVCLRRSAHEGGNDRSKRAQRVRGCLYLPQSLSQRHGARASECIERHHNALAGSQPTYVQGEGDAVGKGVDCLRVYGYLGRQRYALRITSALESSSAFCSC